MQVKPVLIAIALVFGSFLSYARSGIINLTIAKSSTLSFTANAGQIVDQHRKLRTDIDARLFAGNGLNIFVGKNVVTYQWASVKHDKSSGDTSIAMFRMDVALVGANSRAELSYEKGLPYYERHYTSGLSSGSVARSYGALRYRDVYPGIDWVLYASDGKLKYDFIVHPGGKVSDIQLQYSGASALTLNKDGSLSAVTPMGSIGDGKPVSYTQEGGAVGSCYVLNGNVVSFAVEDYSGTLVIDPSISWTTYMGGLGNDHPAGISNDASGNVYMAGGTLSLDNIATTGAYQQSYAGSSLGSFIMGDAFLSKFDPSGNCLWATYYGGAEEDRGLSVSVDRASGKVYLAGSTMSPVGIATTGSHQTTSGGNIDAFLACFDTSGQRIWSTYYGGADNDGDTYAAMATACDNTGNIYLTAATFSTSGISSSGSWQPATAGGSDAFMVKFNSSGTRIWATYFGGTGTDNPTSLGCDSSGNVMMGGHTDSPSGLATAGSEQSVHGGGTDGFIAKWSPTGSLVWATYLGGPGYDDINALTVGATGRLYVAGSTESITGISTAGIFQSSFGGGPMDGFVAAYGTDGVQDWSSYYGGSDIDVVTAVAYSNQHQVYLAGYTISNNNMTTPGSLMDTLYNGTSESFIARFDTSGQRNWGTYHGGSGFEINTYLSLQGPDVLYLCGLTSSADGLATPGAYQGNYGGGDNDAYLSKIQLCEGPVAPVFDMTPNPVCSGEAYTYSVIPIAGVTQYSWTLPTGWLGNSTTNTISVTTGSNSGILSVAAVNECKTGDTALFSVTTLPAPEPVVVANGNVLSTTQPYSSYQWIRDNNDIPGGTSATYVADIAGIYTVRVKATNDCEATSDTVSAGSVGIYGQLGVQPGLSVYPNPTVNKIYIKSAIPLKAILSSLEGRALRIVDKADEISLEHLADGIYLLHLYEAGRNRLIHVQKIYKQGK